MKLSKGRKWLFTLILVVLMPAVLFLLLELALRIIGYGYPSGFFVKREINGQPFFTDNLKFGWRFFPPELARPSSRLAVPVKKSPQSIRIFVLGGSAAMGDPDFSFGFSRMLEKMLQHQYPKIHFEVINAAITAINSNVLLPIAKDCAKLQPDLFIVYLGNNEVIGPYGPGTVFAPFSSNLTLLRANIFLNTTKIGQMVSSVRGKLNAYDDTTRTWGGVDMFIENRIRFNDPRMSAVYDHFRENLCDICKVGQQAGAKVIVSTVPTNLKNCAPFGSLHQPMLTGEALKKWEQFYNSGIAAENSGKFEVAIEAYRKAVEIDAEFADLQFRLARCYMALDQYVTARNYFIQAREWDALRFRADTRINEIIRQIIFEESAKGVFLIDAAETFRQESAHGIPGERLFYDHVHLNFHGNYRLASMVKEQVETVLSLEKPEPPLSEAECAAQLAFTPWDQYRLEKEIFGRMQSPAFANQLNNAEAVKQKSTKLDSIRAGIQPETLADAVKTYRQAIDTAPQDWVLHNNFGLLLLEAGNNPAEAVEQFRSVLRRFPYDYLTHNNLGLAYAQQGKLRDAMVCYNEALRIKPGFTKANFNLGEAFECQSNYEEALHYFHRAQLAPQELASIHYRIGSHLASAGQTDAAIRQFESALSFWPKLLNARIDLGSLRFKKGNYEGAIAHYQAALLIKPNLPEVQNNLGLALCKQGKFEPAVPYFQNALKIKPDYLDARNNLAGALSQLGRSKEAIAQLQELLRMSPNNPGLHNNLGGELLRLGRTKEAIVHFKKALQINPGLLSARRNLAVAKGRLRN